MIFTVEPMINLGRPHVKVLADGWTAVTRDRSLSAQFEHTVGVTETGVRDFHHFAQRASTSRPTSPDAAKAPSLPAGKSLLIEVRESLQDGGRMSSDHLAEGPAKVTEEKPHYHGHRERLRARFREAGAGALSDYELLELLLFRAHAARRRKAAG